MFVIADLLETAGGGFVFVVAWFCQLISCNVVGICESFDGWMDG